MAPITPAYVAAALAAQGVALAPGRAERIARALAPTVASVVADAAELPFDLESPAFAPVLRRCSRRR